MVKNFLEQRELTCRNAISKYLQTLPTFCLEFFLAKENTTSALTRQNYAQDLNVFFSYLARYKFFKDSTQICFEDLDTLKSKDIEQFLSYLSYYEQNGKIYKNKENGKARKLSAIKSFFKFNFKNDNLKLDITSKVETPKLRTKDIVRLETYEVSNLLEQADCPTKLTLMQTAFNKHTKSRDIAILTLFLGTGIRVSELVGINIEDIDFENNSFKVVRKGGNSVILYYSNEVRDALLAYLEDREKILCGNNDNSFFVSLQKRRITVRAVENIVKKYAKAISPLKNISPHKLRSTYGTNLYRETKDIYVVAEVLGHKDVNTTKKHYAALSEDIKKNASTKVKLRHWQKCKIVII